ncbi:unnamed protein product [Allacma fusca]|uniref:Tetratricopeptide repeat protein n=1 Tax=Allacma fusca TaxID=39272 RepID=A0A8J2NV73_9HEXA|nr:unnamed protein product [Allacma fusca]
MKLNKTAKQIPPTVRASDVLEIKVPENTPNPNDPDEEEEEGEWASQPRNAPLKREPSRLEPLETPNAAKRKLMNTSMARQKFKRAVLQAASTLTHEFHGSYMNRLLMTETGQNLLDAENPASTFETIKKGFLYHLNSTGQYLVLREHMRHAVSHLIQQSSLMIRPAGFKNNKDFQNFLHDMYIFLSDEMHESLNETNIYEAVPSDDDPRALEAGASKVEYASRQLYSFAEEAMAQGDLENCHRLHLQRICLNSEAPEPWVDFAIMWCARGEDRMAEIALREALKLNPYHVHALLLSGIISARHRDDRAIGFIGQALSLYPLSPEITVLLASAHNLLGNSKAAKYFFLKGRLLHTLLTGQDPTRAEKELNDFREYPEGKPVEEKPDAPDSSATTPGRSRGRKGKKSKGSSKDSSKKSDKKSKSKTKSAGAGDEPGASSRSKKGKKGSKKKGTEDHVTPMVNETDPLFSRKMTISGNERSKPPAQAALKLSYDFPLEITDDNMDRMYLPSLGPSIMFTWDVTNFGGSWDGPMGASTRGILNPQLHESHFRKFSQIDFDAKDEELLKNLSIFIDNPESVAPVSKKPSMSEPSTSRSVKKKKEKGTEPNSSRSDRKKKGKEATSKSSSKSDSRSGSKKSGKSQDSKSSKKKSKKSKDSKNKKGKISSEAVVEAETAKPEEPQRRIWTMKLGSEYTWTAQLLLRYHAHDFLDSILARELHLTEDRSAEFIYLLAQSLNLRDRQGQANAMIDQLLQKPEHQTNPYQWELKGHIQNAMGEAEDCFDSYQKSLNLAEPDQNMQMTYLRFGTLSALKDNTKLAKTILIKGVHTYKSLYMWLALGDLCFQQGQYSEAETAFSQANQLDNTNPDIWGKLALVSLVQENKHLAEQCYKWAIRFGLKPGPLLEEIKKLQQDKGYGDPSFPRVPNCIPHEFYVKRLGLHNPLDIYRQALESPSVLSPSHANTEEFEGLEAWTKPSMPELTEEEEEDEEQDEIEFSNVGRSSSRKY